MKNRCKKVFLLLLLVGITPAVMAQYGFGTSTPDKNAVVDVNSTTKGFLPPRLTQTQIEALALLDPKPTEGLIVYNTDKHCLMYYSLGAFTYFYMPAGLAPVASDVTVAGNMLAGATLTATYNYTQGDKLAAGMPTYKWYSATGSDGSNIKFFSGATSTYTIPSGKEGTYMRVGVTPVTATGKTGSEVLSSWRKVVTNAAPVVSGVSVTGTPMVGLTFMVGSTLTATVPLSNITDFENDGPITLAYKWYSATKSDGSDGIALLAVTTNTYAIPSGKEGTYVRVGVTPTATAGTSLGIESYSPWYRVNSAPSYTGLAISPSVPGVGGVPAQVMGNYTDGDGDLAGTHTYQWYRCTDAAGGGKSAIASATSSTYTFTNADLGSYIVVGVTAKAITGVLQGTEQLASAVGPVGITVKHLATDGVSPVGGDITYPVVKFSDKLWLGRNLGATEAPGSFLAGSAAAGGWFWQFNRKQGYNYDGIRIPSASWPAGDTGGDWLPVNDPCTSLLGAGWRLPTSLEWGTVVTFVSPSPSGQKLYDGVLRLHAAGYLDTDGSLYSRGSSGNYWGSSQGNAANGHNLNLSSINAYMNGDLKANGFSVRCLRDF